MSFILFADSFGRYDLGQMSNTAILANLRMRYQSVSVNGFCVIASDGRTDRAITMQNGSLSKTLGHSDTWTFGFAFRNNGVLGGNAKLIELANNDVPIFQLFFHADGTLSCRAGNNSSNTIGVSTRALLTSRYYWIDCTVIYSGATISVTAEVRINTNVEISGTKSSGITAASLLSGDSKSNVITITDVPGTAQSSSFCDFFIKNNSGYYGDVSILPLYANGDVVTDWTPAVAGSLYTMINGHPVNLSNYIQAATIGKQAIFDWQDCPGFSGTLKAVGLSFLARKDAEGTKTFKIVTGDTGTEDASEDFYVSDATEEYYEHGLELDPATALAWTQAGFNAKRFGVKITT